MTTEKSNTNHDPGDEVLKGGRAAAAAAAAAAGARTKDDIIARAMTVQPDLRSPKERRRDWLDFNHILGLTIFGLAVCAGIPLTVLGVTPLMYPIVGVLAGIQLSTGKTWIPVSSPRLNPVWANRAKQLTDDVCQTIGCKVPQVSISLSATQNAAATSMGGRGRMLITGGLLAKLSDDEARAVIAHEMGHIRQRHLAIIRVLTWPVMFVDLDRIAAGALTFMNLAGLPGFVTSTLVWAGFLGGINGAMRLAERSADHYSALITGHPEHLASALRKIDPSHGKPARTLRDVFGSNETGSAKKLGQAALVILNKASGLILVNHPPIATRIAYLEKDQLRIADRASRAMTAASAQPTDAAAVPAPEGAPQATRNLLRGMTVAVRTRHSSATPPRATPEPAGPASPLIPSRELN